jgi:tetratricopeptide (TPR) repeat protein
MGEKKGNTSTPKRMSIKTFLVHFMRIINKSRLGRRFCFIIGAGASIQSGIPTGAELVKKWLEELREMYDDEELEKWKEEEDIKGLENGEAARYYPQIYEKRFSSDPEEGYFCLEDIIERKEPSFGYSVLAKILAETHHNVVITTNFDSLVEDALFIYTNKRPLVCGHEALAGFISPIMRRPLIAKIHRDVLLAPISDPQGTRILAEGWKKSLANIFKFYTPVIIGYGGNDGSLMGFLNALEPIDGGMFWCYWQQGGKPEEEILQLVMKHNGYLVPIIGFDELMLQLNDKLGYPLLHESIVSIAKEKAKNYQDQVENIQKKLSQSQKPSDSAAKAALKRTIEKQKKDWWSFELLASSETDPDKKEEIYLQGLREIPGSAELTGNYANFLKNIRKDYDKAEELYKKSLELDPQNVTHTGNYANFLSDIRKDYDKAEELYKKALELDPKKAINTGNYANFLHIVRKDYDKAEELYKKSLELDPQNAIHTGNYAFFQENIRKDFDKTEELYIKSLELDPQNAINKGNYASFLHTVKKDYDKAEELYKKSLELDPQNAINTGNYASFLHTVRKDYDKAEELYKKSLELDPQNAINAGNYAQMLLARGNKKQGEKYLEKAFSLKPPDEGLLLEMWFYRYAHLADRYEQADKEIIKLLKKGVRSPGWDLSPNIERAKLDGHPAADRLEKLAKIITGDAPLDTLG